jgi:serine/threonine-protein kinase
MVGERTGGGPKTPGRGLRAGEILQATYEVVRLAGRGGMGEVYEARHLRIPGRFAVKILHGQDTSREALAQLRREAEITSSLRHPNIVQVLDFNQLPDGTPYIVMEFLEGVDLGQRLAAAGRLSPFDVVKFVAQIASGLAAAHAHGVVHRDLKPQNVFVLPMAGQAREFVKVLDFGISTIANAKGTVAADKGDDTVAGTPQYMSPEQAVGNPDVDGKTDQFALAAIAYEMLTGRQAFPGKTLPAVLFNILHGEPLPLPATVLATLGVQGDAALRRALSKQSAERYEDVLAFAQAMQEAVLWGSGLRTPRPVDVSDALEHTPSPSLELAVHEAAVHEVAPTITFAPAAPDAAELQAHTLSAIPTQVFAVPSASAAHKVSRRRHRFSIALLSLVAAGGWLTALISPRALEDRVEQLTAPLFEDAERLKVAARPSGTVFIDFQRPPPGLTVTLDGQSVSVPVVLMRGTTAYHMRVEAPDYQPYELWVDAVTDRTLDLPMLRKPRR